MLPTIKPDTETKATEAQILQALASLAGLPSRQADDEGIDRQMYFVALEGVTRYALNEAVKSCSRGGHGHEFFPNTVELRRECDRAQRPINEMARRIRLTEEQIRERREYERAQAAKTPEARAKVAEAYARYCASHQSDRPSEPEGLKLTPEQLADVPDAPSTFRRVG